MNIRNDFTLSLRNIYFLNCTCLPLFYKSRVLEIRSFDVVPCIEKASREFLSVSCLCVVGYLHQCINALVKAF